MSFLLDTCAISELIRKHPNEGLLKWLRDQEEYHLFLSAITLGEITKGIHKLPHTAKQDLLQKWVDEDLMQRFKERLLVINGEICQKWGALSGTSEKTGIKVPVVDGLIAATASVYSLTVVTRNTPDFINCHISILNPWTN